MDTNIKTTKKILEDRVRAMEAAKNKISPEIQEMSQKIVERWERVGVKFGNEDNGTATLEKKAERLRKFSSILK